VQPDGGVRETHPTARRRLTAPAIPDRRQHALQDFDAVHPGTHGIRAYLSEDASGQTHAHAAAWWTTS
jgi:hypothetical protein